MSVIPAVQEEEVQEAEKLRPAQGVGGSMKPYVKNN
jgi:hypothetical protein